MVWTAKGRAARRRNPDLAKVRVTKSGQNGVGSKGLIEESRLDSFNMPFYAPSAEEVRHIIEKEGSFNIHQLQTFHLSWVQNFDNDNKKGLELDKYAGGNQVADRSRAAVESLLVNHFGKAIMDDLFQRFSIKVTEHLEMEAGAYPNV
ncbi:hypothetical protein Pint_01829 [Pistacia integerrima]|uniref:Uncharacterized protein n=1 Tax=Pistacia integerrima TaxID=434235 RepID=A0ACC0ZNY2_9ROSI|nr:hypothetical protein Pint_01829 [Pistacia integerrima]